MVFSTANKVSHPHVFSLLCRSLLSLFESFCLLKCTNAGYFPSNYVELIPTPQVAATAPALSPAGITLTERTPGASASVAHVPAPSGETPNGPTPSPDVPFASASAVQAVAHTPVSTHVPGNNRGIFDSIIGCVRLVFFRLLSLRVSDLRLHSLFLSLHPSIHPSIYLFFYFLHPFFPFSLSPSSSRNCVAREPAAAG